MLKPRFMPTFLVSCVLSLSGMVFPIAAIQAAEGPVRRPHVEAELVSENLSLQPGQTAWLGLRLKLERGWHVYWENPGDSGLKPELALSSPTTEAAALQFPIPERIPVPPLMNYGYEGEVLFPFPVKISSSASGSSMRFEGKASWLVCQDTCIPGKADLTLVVDLKSSAPAPHPDWSTLFGKTRQQLPRPPDGLRFSAWADAERVRIRIQGESDAPLPDSNLEFFPLTEGAVEHPAEILTQVTNTEASFEFKRPQNAPSLGNLDGIVVFRKLGLSYRFRAPAAKWSADLTPITPSSRPAETEPRSLAWMLVFALLGGLILNIMPCVFPVISIKILSLMDSADRDPALIRKHGFVFSAGVTLSFVVLGGVLFLLRATGLGLGWGFQLQSPLFVVLLAVLFFLMGLNLLGVFEIGTRLMGMGGESQASRKTLSGSFYSGVLATIVATPCSAPFMGAALGFALLQPLLSGLMIFLFLGLGMALPYIALTLRPDLLRLLPRPGRWMETFKQFLAFPMFATVLWLVWVLGVQRGVDVVVALLGGFILISLGFWIHQRSRQSALLPIVSLALVLIGVALPLRETGLHFSGGEVPSAGAGTAFGDLTVHAFSPTKVDELRRQGKPVFLYFTAAWCVSCKVNERVAFSDSTVIERMRTLGLQIVKADWTNYDADITRALESFERSGVPLYVLFSANSAEHGRVLPEILTPGIVLKHLESPSK